MTRFLSFLIELLTEMITYRKFAEAVVWLSDLVFNGLTAFLSILIDMQDKRLADLEADGADEVRMDAEKDISAMAVVAETAAHFSGSPSYVPRGIIKIVLEALVYRKHHPEDERNKEAHEHGFFRAHTDDEMKEAVDALNRGFTSK